MAKVARDAMTRMSHNRKKRYQLSKSRESLSLMRLSLKNSVKASEREKRLPGHHLGNEEFKLKRNFKRDRTNRINITNMTRDTVVVVFHSLQAEGN